MKNKTIVDPDMATAMLAILLERLKVIKLQPHRRDFYQYADPIPRTAIRGMTMSSGSLYYTAEKYNP